MAPSYVHCPETREDADAIVQALINNPPRHAESIQQSIRYWHQTGCHHFAQAAKNCYQYGQRNMLGSMLVSMANAAIITEHRLALVI